MPARARRVGWLLRCASRAAKLVFDFDDAPARSVCALYKAFRLHGISSKMILVDAWSQVHTAPAVALCEPFVPSHNHAEKGWASSASLAAILSFVATISYRLPIGFAALECRQTFEARINLYLDDIGGEDRNSISEDYARVAITSKYSEYTCVRSPAAWFFSLHVASRSAVRAACRCSSRRAKAAFVGP